MNTETFPLFTGSAHLLIYDDIWSSPKLIDCSNWQIILKLSSQYTNFLSNVTDITKERHTIASKIITSLAEEKNESGYPEPSNQLGHCLLNMLCINLAFTHIYISKCSLRQTISSQKSFFNIIVWWHKLQS